MPLPGSGDDQIPGLQQQLNLIRGKRDLAPFNEHEFEPFVVMPIPTPALTTHSIPNSNPAHFRQLVQGKLAPWVQAVRPGQKFQIATLGGGTQALGSVGKNDLIPINQPCVRFRLLKVGIHKGTSV